MALFNNYERIGLFFRDPRTLGSVVLNRGSLRMHDFQGYPLREYWYTVSGYVQDQNSAPAAREVRLVDRKSGRIITRAWSDASTGFFSVQVPLTNELQAVFLDADDATVFNDKIHRVVPA